MKVLGVKDCSVEMAFCHLRCPYCVHIMEDYSEVSVEEVARKLEKCQSVYIGGAEPTVQKTELLKLLELLKGKRITLKTDGMMPDVIENASKYVDRFVFEIKTDFDDIKGISRLTGLNEERAVKYAENLLKSIQVAKEKGKKIRLWVRVIPGYVTEESLRKAFRKVGKVDEILLYQFLSREDWDREFDNVEKPEFDYVLKMGEVAREFAEKVIVVGDRRVTL